jgi:RHH-type proline utilization regulon transcriptional repressor/proline dehydrogenase/delta 1-pyrroline-5-carboxylate dehydrogenase
MSTPELDGLRAEFRAWHRRDEQQAGEALIEAAGLSGKALTPIDSRAAELAEGVRGARRRYGGVDRFLSEYGLSTGEGVALMCLAEALLRIPDAETKDRLIADKLAAGDWRSHLGKGEGLFVNASTWALMLTGKMLEGAADSHASLLDKALARMGEPVVRRAMDHAMRIMGRQFVMGRSIKEALERAREAEGNTTHSFDMLGEAAKTSADAARYFAAYESAIHAIGRAAAGKGVRAGPGISVKLSALHPRYDHLQRARCVPELAESLAALCRLAARYEIGLCVDAEESERLDLSLDILERVAGDPSLEGWQGLGLAVQAYQKRAFPLIDWLAALAREKSRKLMLRLVKGAYWDSEIKWAQQGGYDGYPVFTRKAATDVSYIACARKILAAEDAFYPQFATHNAHTLAAIEHFAGERDYEFQRLHGMGEPLYHQISRRVRVYAPVGSHEDLLPYLVRRLLENGANTSFVARLQNDSLPVADLVADPARKLRRAKARPHPRIPLPAAIYGRDRENAPGCDLKDPLVTKALAAGLAGRELPPPPPALEPGAVTPLMDRAAQAFPAWADRGAEARAECLLRLGDRLAEERDAFLHLLAEEGGKPLPEAVGEWRETIDYCRYYAAEARAKLAPLPLPGPTGESNRLILRPRGVIACISPWNFPLAIFGGQCLAALAAGNTVIAKPAEQTPRIAAALVRLGHDCGIPEDAWILATGSGSKLGPAMLSHPALAGVAFTGGTDTARRIARSLAERAGPLVPFIAETGGQNAMIVDSSALPEQVVEDAIASAFRSAGQRCSALRVLCLQEEIADKVIDMLKGASEELVIGAALDIATDIGPVIDDKAREALEAHKREMDGSARKLFSLPLPEPRPKGSFFAPCCYEIPDISVLTEEHFGPILHVVRFPAGGLEGMIDRINATGYGLTLGLHSRLDSAVATVTTKARVGNIYVNRNMVGAVVGVQPFGGEGLSGTGPKAGGPHYLPRFCVERTITINTTAAGGNTSLVTLEAE